ncbi:hypothetical protein G5I_12934 [Acromyrmex echinatior]|uniref:Uncharacterized protein n=1 Tax=Acromyrmex echinatior TaxID=103372 RepID=F4X3M6_ACREC|nr:hypothetical protein G5I_12934 [Acromyrmex echinatior]
MVNQPNVSTSNSELTRAITCHSREKNEEVEILFRLARFAKRESPRDAAEQARVWELPTSTVRGNCRRSVCDGGFPTSPSPLYSARRAPDVPPGAGEGEGDSVSAPVPPLTHAGNKRVSRHSLRSPARNRSRSHDDTRAIHPLPLPSIPLVPFQRTLASARATGRLVATGFGSRATRLTACPVIAYSRILGSGRTIDIDRLTTGDERKTERRERTWQEESRTSGFAAPYDLDYRGLRKQQGKKYPSACTLQSFRCSMGGNAVSDFLQNKEVLFKGDQKVAGENSFDRFYTSSCDNLGFDLAIIAYLTRLQCARTFLHRSSWNRGLLVLTGDYALHSTRINVLSTIFTSNYLKVITYAHSHQLSHRDDNVDNYKSCLRDMNSEGRPHDTLASRNRHGRLKVVDFNERKVN